MTTKKKVDDELRKAGEHFIRATTEGIIGAGLTVKGLKNMLRESEGRRSLLRISGKLFAMGMGLMMSVPQIIKEVREYRSESRKQATNRSRKIKID
ncbi:MAG: hypothetical protein ACRENZ_00030 [Thermodesulfobacteriota bacterium]